MVLLAAVAAGSVLTFSAASAARKPVTKTFHAALTGEAESPAGDPVATGTATIRLRTDGRVCYQLAAKNLPRALAAHIHKGKAGVSGNVVVPLKTPNAAGNAKGCTKAKKALVRSMIKSPSAFYVNVHTAEFPNGAIRGQLKGSSTKSFGTIVKRTLNGTSEPNATGSAVLRFRPDDGLVCFRLTAGNVTLPTIAAHIHRGAAGANGNVVVPLKAPDANGTSDGCTAADQSLIQDILGSLSGYYVNVHTKEHPGGAIRAQLA
jgi:hypothetical protein